MTLHFLSSTISSSPFCEALLKGGKDMEENVELRLRERQGNVLRFDIFASEEAVCLSLCSTWFVALKGDRGEKNKS